MVEQGWKGKLCQATFRIDPLATSGIGPSRDAGTLDIATLLVFDMGENRLRSWVSITAVARVASTCRPSGPTYRRYAPLAMRERWTLRPCWCSIWEKIGSALWCQSPPLLGSRRRVGPAGQPTDVTPLSRCGDVGHCDLAGVRYGRKSAPLFGVNHRRCSGRVDVSARRANLQALRPSHDAGTLRLVSSKRRLGSGTGSAPAGATPPSQMRELPSDSRRFGSDPKPSGRCAGGLSIRSEGAEPPRCRHSRVSSRFGVPIR
ncbi:hypothetical protein SCOR_03465 [Sulfidibacter corallicola]